MQLGIVQRRASYLLLASLIAIGAIALFTTSAHAAGSASLSADNTTLTYTGTVNTTSNLKVSFNGVAYILEETAGNSAAPLTAGAGCTVVTNYKKISCASLELTAINLNMGNLLDSLTMGATALIPSHVLTTVTEVGNVTSSDGPMEIHCSDVGATSVVGGNGYDNIFTEAIAPNVAPTPNINGGAKDDQITLKNSLVQNSHTNGAFDVNGGPGHDMVDGTGSTAAFNYSSSPGTDVVLGGPSHDEFTFGDDRDLVFGNGGDDRFYSTGVPSPEGDLSEIWGGPGDDVFTDRYPQQFDMTHYEGGPGIDRVTYMNQTNSGAWSQNVQVSLDDVADDGNIIPGGGSEGDHIHPSVENIGNYDQVPTMNQMTGDDVLIGSPKANEIMGSLGSDYIEGGAGNDHLSGEDYNDTVYGGDGSDLIDSLADGDALDGGSGEDRVSFAAVAGSVVIDLHPETFSPGWMESIENATGTSFADTITGNDDPNKVDGADGDDTFYMSGGGSDQITCGSGTDTVTADATDVIVDGSACESVTIE